MTKLPVMLSGRKPARAKLRAPASAPVTKDSPTDSGPLSIQGFSASAAEWSVYKGLRSLGWDDEIQFQSSILGGRLFPGGQVLDFVLLAGPASAVIDVRGLHWHGPAVGRSARDRWREIQLAALPNAPRLVIVWEDVALNPARLRALLLRELGAKR